MAIIVSAQAYNIQQNLQWNANVSGDSYVLTQGLVGQAFGQAMESLKWAVSQLPPEPAPPPPPAPRCATSCTPAEPCFGAICPAHKEPSRERMEDADQWSALVAKKRRENIRMWLHDEPYRPLSPAACDFRGPWK